MLSLDRFLARIRYEAAPRADAATLRGVHRAFVEEVPYENLDVQLARPLTRDVAAAYDKIVERGRGGWCYEMNGLLAWALEEIGFSVRRLSGGVGRETSGASAVGNHLVLLVDGVDGATWLADAGFGDGLVEAVPLRAGPFSVGPLACALSEVEDGWWRFANDPSGAAPTFDFHPDVSDEALLDASCARLQTDLESPFVLNAVVQRWRNDAHMALRGRVLTVRSADGKSQRLIRDARDYTETLRDLFSLDAPEAAALWPRVRARHEALFGGQS